MSVAHEHAVSGPAQSVADTIAAHVPVLSTLRLTLRAPRLPDFATYAQVACGPRATGIGGPSTRTQAWDDFMRMVGLWLLRGHGIWTLEERVSAEVVGFVLIGFEPGDQEPELGYLMAEAHEGQGYATEAARAVLAYAFGPMRLPTLASLIDPGNARSIALARRLGARLDGVVAGAQIWRYSPQEAV